MNVDRITRAAIPLPESKTSARPQTAEPESAPTTVPDNRDVCDISPDWENAINWEEMLKNYLAQISNTYHHIDIVIGDTNDLQAYGASKGAGAHLLISSDFLSRMVTGTESFFKGKALLDNVLQQLSAQGKDGAGAGAYLTETSLTFWSATPKKDPFFPHQEKDDSKTLFELMEEFRRQAEERKEKFSIRLGPSAFNSPAEAFGRLARAVTVPHVRSAMSMAERNICTLKLALSIGPEKEKAKIRAAISALEKVVARGSGKIRDLNNEDDIRRRQKRAEQERQRRKSEQLRYELKQRQTARHAREHAQITEGQPWFYYQEEFLRKKQISRPEDLQPAPDIPMDMGIGVMPIEMGTGGGEFTAADVSVSPSIDISI